MPTSEPQLPGATGDRPEPKPSLIKRMAFLKSTVVLKILKINLTVSP